MRKSKRLTRRDFLKGIGAGGLALASGCISLPSPKEAGPGGRPGRLRFGVIADVHRGLHPKAQERLAPFIEEMNGRKVDFIIQLGDFCQGYAAKKRAEFDGFMNLWNSFNGPTYHVLGNHDMDACSKTAVMEYWGMEANYYSFDRAGYHFVVLDSNYFKSDGQFVEYENGNYYKYPQGRSYLTPPQLAWLKRDLAATNSPTIVFSHRGLDPLRGVKDGDAARAILEDANRAAGFQKVVACLCGHYHRDGHEIIHGIPYILINSAVYHWLGGKWKWIEYADSLYAIVALKPGRFEMKGRKSELVAPWPPDAPDAPEVDADVTAAISSLRLSWDFSRHKSGRAR